MITGVSMADTGKKKKCYSRKNWCAKSTKECRKEKDKTAKLQRYLFSSDKKTCSEMEQVFLLLLSKSKKYPPVL